MSIPKYNELYLPFLSVLKDGMIHTLSEIKSEISQSLHLTAEELSVMLSSKKQSVFDNRVSWAGTYLKKAGLILSPQRAHFQISPEGLNLYNDGIEITNDLLQEKYPDFLKFTDKKSNPPEQNDSKKRIKSPETDIFATPLETLEHVYQTINEQLADDLLMEIMSQSPCFFEHLVVDLMTAMNYGNGFVTKTSCDGGIDGIIHEDKLGFNLIYIQAKRWDTDRIIRRPEIQKFAGAMMGPPKIEKGLFITTAKFSQGAVEYAAAQHIILVDGQKLTALMIEYDLGVSTQKIYKIKRIDTDYFSDT